jgi:hypothetical protein
MATKNLCAMLMLATLATVSLNSAAMAQQSGSARIQKNRLTTGRAKTPTPRRSVSNRSAGILPNTASILPQEPIPQVKAVKKGGWRTLENFWNTKATIVFVKPAGATVKIRYGSTKKYFGKNRQRQRLKGNEAVVLKIGRASAVRARVQIYVERDTDVTYYVNPGDVNSVTIPF